MNRLTTFYAANRGSIFRALAVLSLVAVAMAFPDSTYAIALAAGAPMLMLGETSPAVLELFKSTPWRPGVDPMVGINTFKKALFRDDGQPNGIPYNVLKDRYGQTLNKAFTQSASATSGLTQYDLEQGAKLLYPVTTIFRNMIPRVTGGLGIQANWRSVTAINPGQINAGLSEGHRGAAMAQTVVDRLAAFKTSGLDNFVTEQAYLAAVTFEDLMALAATTTLQGTMEAEEHMDIGANSSLLLGTTPTTVSTDAATGGHLSDATYSLICVALTYFGMENSTAPTEASGGGLSGGAVALPYTRSNMDGSTDLIQGFSGIASTAESVTVNGGGSAQVINATVTAVRGALGYAWYLQSGGTGSERLVKITGYPTAVITNTNSTGQLASALPATDTSTNSLNYDGMLTQILTSGSGAYWADLGGSPLTSAGTGTGGITEFNTALASFYDNYRLIPTDIFMNGYDQQKAGQLVLSGNTNLAPFFMGQNASGGLNASTVLTEYINPIGFGNTRLQVHAHPFIPRGTVIFYSRSNPYPLSNVPALIRKLCRRDYWQVDWPVVTLQRTLGVYFDAVLQMYFNPAFGAITGIKM